GGGGVRGRGVLAEAVRGGGVTRPCVRRVVAEGVRVFVVAHLSSWFGRPVASKRRGTERTLSAPRNRTTTSARRCVAKLFLRSRGILASRAALYSRPLPP